MLPALPDTPEETQQLYNPTLLPGESYYNPDRQSTPGGNAATQGSGSGAASPPGSGGQQYANPVPVDQLQAQAPAQTPAAASSLDPAETPVPPMQQPAGNTPDTLTPAPATPTPPEQQAAGPQQPYQVPTMPAEQMFPQQTGSSGAASSGSTGGSAAPSSSSGGSSSPGAVPGLSAELQAGLDLTNSLRRQHQAPDLTWDAAIASQAAAYVAGCPNGHSGAPGFGENLAWGYDSMSAAVQAWYDEVAAYNFASCGFSGATGHFTQLVWRDTVKVGCAVNKACAMPTYICQYSPPGASDGPVTAAALQQTHPQLRSSPQRRCSDCFVTDKQSGEILLTKLKCPLPRL